MNNPLFEHDVTLEQRVAIKAHLSAGRLLMQLHRTGVYNADTQAEAIIINTIEETFPDDDFLSEEKGLVAKNSNRRWVIDPLDGTNKYYDRKGLNHEKGEFPFTIGIALEIDQLVILSSVYHPQREELYLALKGKGAKLNGQPMSVSTKDRLKDAVLMSHISTRKGPDERTRSAIERIQPRTDYRILRYGSGLAQLCYVATGRHDGFFNADTYLWDIQPATLLVEEAGGRVTDIYGNKITRDSRSILATNGKIHDEMLEQLKGF